MPTERFSLQVDVDTKGASKQLGSLGASIAKVAGAAGFALLAKQVVQTGMKFQDLRVQLETVTGSAERAKAAFAGIQDFSAKTPFQVENVTRAFTNLSAKGFAPTAKSMEALGNMAAAFGTDITQATQAVTQAAFGEAEMLKQYGIIMRQQGDTVKLTYKGVTEEIEKDSGQIYAALTRLAEVNFAGGMERQSKTLSGTLSTLKDNWSILLDTIASDTGVIDGLTKGVVWLTGAIQTSVEVVENWGTAWNQLGADMTRGVTKAFASVNRSIAKWIADMALSLHNAPWIVRAILDPGANMQKSGFALAMAFAETADEIERFGGDLADVFEEAAQASLKIDDMTGALGDLEKQAGDTGGALSGLAKAMELVPERIEAGGVVNWEDQGDAFTRAMRQGIVNARPMVARVLSDAAESGLTEGSERAAANARGPWEALFKDVFGKQYWTDVGLMIGDAIADAIINGDTSNLKEQFGQLGREVGGQMGATFGMMVGGPVGAVIGNVLGQIIGQKVGEVVGGFIGDVLQALGLAPDPKRVLGSFAIGPGGFEGVGGTADAQGVGRQMLAEINRIFDALNNAIQGTVNLTQNMEIQVRRNGQAILQIIETATGNVLSEQTFASVQEAMEAGLVQLLSTSILNMPEGPLTAAFQELFGRVAELGTEGLVEAFEKLAGVGQQLSALGDAGDRLRATLAAGLGAFDKLRADIQSLGLSAEVTAGLLADVAAKERRYNMELRRTALGQLAAWAKELGVNVRIQRKVAILEAKVRAKKLEIELKMLGMWERWGGLVKELRNLSIEAARAIGKAADTVSQFSNAANTFASTAATAGRAANDFASGIDTVKVRGGGGKKKAKRDQFASLIDQLAGTGSSNQSAFDALFESYQDAIAWTKKNKPKVKDAFGKLREAFEEGWARLVDDLKGGLQEFRDGLALQFGQGTPAGFAQDAESNFQQLLEAALGGDVGALAALQAAADQTLTLGAQAYGTSTQAFMDLFAMVTSGLDQALGTDFAAPLDQTVTAIKEQTDVTVTALQQLRDTVQIEANLDRVILGEIRDAMTWKERVVQV